jgi:transposase InsO family protein
LNAAAKAEILRVTTWLKAHSGQSERQLCRALGLTWGRYQSWRRRERQGLALADAGAGGGPGPDAPLPWEITAAIDHALAHPKDGYRRLTWQMIDEDVAYLSESSVYRILAERNLLCRWQPPARSPNAPPARPTAPHQRWHTDIMYLMVDERWYFLVTFLDAYSRYIVHWDLLTSMTTQDITVATLAALEKYPGQHPVIVTDHGCQYTSRDFKRLLRRFEIEHILCRVRHPQSNGVLERYHRTTRAELADHELQDLGQARRIIERWVEEYNERRLHAGLKYLRPADYFRGDPEARLNERHAKLRRARQVRRQAWREGRVTGATVSPIPFPDPNTNKAKAPSAKIAVGSI